MSDGIYTAASGLLIRQRQLAAVSHNLANATTPGYLQEGLRFQDQLISKDDSVHQVDEGERFLRQNDGFIEDTGRPLDFAASDGAVFVVGNGNQVALTRNGSFEIGSNGTIVNRAGLNLMSTDLQPIDVGSLEGGQLHVDSDGNFWAGDNLLGTMATARIKDDDTLKPMGNATYEVDPKKLELIQGVEVMQGHLHTSNVNSVQSTTDMITLHRHFEAMQTLVQTFKKLDSKAIEALGRPVI
jgi:flagellar basal-body rod protein FlgF